MNTSTVRGRSAAGTVALWLDLQDTAPEGTRLSELSAMSAAGTIAGAGLGPDTGVAAARQVCDALRTVVVALPPSLADRVDRTNQVVALPANDTGIAAMEALLARGLPVHLATCFSARRYEQAAAAYLSALTRAHAEGRDLAALASTVAFGLRPLDLRVDALLDRAGGEEAKALRGTAALLAARLARRASARIFDPRTSSAWAPLAAAGARPLRLVWTELGDLAPAAGAQTDYAAELADGETALAVPAESLDTATGLRPRPARSDRGLAAQAQHFEACLRWFGIRTEELVRELEGEPVACAAPPQGGTLVAGGVS
ncbi:transaldolase family protein [Streptomyces sp. ZAF1911]|uniref:transaldolase family protein n=1 Tax=Streptomyces sp. ZAF1911 TaxID=2944129 RepID=UPI00237AA03A|nr:transaldolase family protein [Streptomyces sp. ZAF1911]MDD9376872.1 transaldolase family protein [Streptomyces sp. ZAF1911]